MWPIGGGGSNRKRKTSLTSHKQFKHHFDGLEALASLSLAVYNEIHNSMRETCLYPA